MGIKNLFKQIESNNQIIENIDINQFKYKKIAIDISIIIYQIVISIRNSGQDFVNSKGELVSHIYGLFNKIISFLDKGIIPIFVFDGKPPELKFKVIKNRKRNKQKALEKMLSATTKKERIKYFKRCVVIKKKDIELCKKLLQHMGIPYIEAPEEADSQCAQLVKDGLVDGVATEDMDILTFGSSCILRNFSVKKENVVKISLENILSFYNISYQQFICICILLGCDYFPKIPGLNFKYIINLVKNNKINNIIKVLNNDLNKNFDNDQFMKVFNYFLNPRTLNIKSDKLQIKKINYQKLVNFMVSENNFSRYTMRKQIKKLKNIYNNL